MFGAEHAHGVLRAHDGLIVGEDLAGLDGDVAAGVDEDTAAADDGAFDARLRVVLGAAGFIRAEQAGFFPLAFIEGQVRGDAVVDGDIVIGVDVDLALIRAQVRAGQGGVAGARFAEETRRGGRNVSYVSRE